MSSELIATLISSSVVFVGILLNSILMMQRNKIDLDKKEMHKTNEKLKKELKLIYKNLKAFSEMEKYYCDYIGKLKNKSPEGIKSKLRKEMRKKNVIEGTLLTPNKIKSGRDTSEDN